MTVPPRVSAAFSRLIAGRRADRRMRVTPVMRRFAVVVLLALGLWALLALATCELAGLVDAPTVVGN